MATTPLSSTLVMSSQFIGICLRVMIRVSVFTDWHSIYYSSWRNVSVAYIKVGVALT